MTASLFSAPLFAAIAWALLHFVWQGAAVAGALAILTLALRRRAPSVRYAAACGALATLLALPVVTAWSAAASERPTAPAPASQSPLAATGVAAKDAGDPAPAFESAGLLPDAWRTRFEQARPWILSLWFAGVLFLSIRFIGGLSTAQRLTRRGARPAPREWQHTLALISKRLSVTRPVRLLESTIVHVPTAIGALRPVILLPASVLTGLPVRGLEAILAHELAHVRRHDYLVNLLQTVVETLLFYHPAVWWVSSRVRAEREQCCDDLAIAATGDARTYARALVRLEEMRGGAPALAVAAVGGNLWDRVVRVLRESRGSSERSAGWAAGAVALGMLFAIAAAARLGPSSERPSGIAPAADVETAPDAVVRPEGLELASLAIPEDGADDDEDSDAAEGPSDEPDADASDPAESGDVGDPDDSDDVSADDEDAEDDPEASGGTRPLTTDELIAFRVHGVTSEFVRSIAALGYQRADPDDIVALKIHGVTPESIAELNRLFGRQSLDQHVAFRIHGVDAGTLKSLSALGLGKIGPDEALALRIHGVDARFVEGLRAAGFTSLSADDVVAARIHGVQPSDAAAWTKVGFAKPSLEDLTAARIHGVTAAFVEEIRALGYPKVSLDDLVAFRIHGVTAEFIREMRSAGLSSLSGDDAVAFRIHGVTAGFAKEIQAVGYPNATADQLVGLRVHGISADELREMNKLAGRRVPLEELLDRYDDDWEGDDDDED